MMSSRQYGFLLQRSALRKGGAFHGFTRENEPQITRMNADKDRNPMRLMLFPIGARLRNLR
jgi:hypothetical protein